MTNPRRHIFRLRHKFKSDPKQSEAREPRAIRLIRFVATAFALIGWGIGLAGCCSNLDFVELRPPPPSRPAPRLNGPWIPATLETLGPIIGNPAGNGFGLDGMAFLFVETAPATLKEPAKCGLARWDRVRAIWEKSALPACWYGPIRAWMPTGPGKKEAVILYRGGAIATHDGGTSWTLSGNWVSTVERFASKPISSVGPPGTLLASAGGGGSRIYESSNYGESWTNRVAWSLTPPNLGSSPQFVLGEKLLAWAPLRRDQAVWTSILLDPWKKISLSPAGATPLDFAIAPDGKALTGQFWENSTRQHSFCRWTPEVSFPYWRLAHCTETKVAPQLAAAAVRHFSPTSVLLFTPWSAVRSDDSGAKFKSVFTPPPGERLLTVFPFGAEEAMAVLANASHTTFTVLHSSDRGETWETLR